MLLLLTVMVSSCSRGSQRRSATYTAAMICRRSAGFCGWSMSAESGNHTPGAQAAPLRGQQNVTHRLTQVVRFRNSSAGIAAHPDIERQNGSPVVPPLSPGCLCLSATTPFDVIAPPPWVTSPFRITLLLIRVVSASITNSPVLQETTCEDSISTLFTPRIIQRPVAGSYSNQPPSSYAVVRTFRV